MMPAAVKTAARALLPFRTGPVVLMYHRVADADYDPWDLAVSPARFEAQLATLKRERLVLPLEVFGRRLREGSLPRRATAITFDDGYACNALVAAPMLRAFELPATFFLTTDAIGDCREFWWDELARLVIETDPSADTSLTIAGRTFAIDRRLPFVAQETLRTWTWSTPSLEPRLALYSEIWKRMRAAHHSEQRAALDRAWTILGIPAEVRHTHRAMTHDEASTLAQEPLFQIAPHSRSHPGLPSLSEAEQRHEITDSLLACKSLSNQAIAAFAYPYGDFSLLTKQIVSSLGFELACSTRAATVDSRTDPYALPRLQVLDRTNALSRQEINRLTV